MPVTAPEHAVEVIDVCKTYAGQRGQPPVHALDHVSLTVDRGAFFGLLGPNGAGKSTLINILAGLVVETAGTARSGASISTRAARGAAAIGVVPQELNLDPFFTPRELLELQAGLYGVPKTRRRTDGDPGGGRPDREGRRLCRALVGRHAPAADGREGDGARAAGAGARRADRRRRCRAAPAAVGVRARAQRAGTTILLTTHYLEEAEELCDRIAIIDHGQRDRLRHHGGAAAADRRQDN